MTDAQLTQYAENLFPVLAQFIEGTPTMEKIEQAFYAAIQRQNELKHTYLEDADFRTAIHDMLFDSARAQVGAA